MAAGARHRREVGKSILNQDEPALRRSDQIGALRDGALIAIDPDHAAVGGGEQRARKAAGAKGGVDVNSARAHRKKFHGAAAEHGNVTGQSASDSR